MGQQFHNDDIVAYYDFSKVIADVHMDIFCEIGTQLVDWATMTARGCDFAMACKLHASLPWVKVVMLTRQLMSEKTQKAGGGKVYGKDVEAKDWERLLKVDLALMQRIEHFVGNDTMRQYKCAEK